MGKTIFFSTHILADVAQICSQVGIIEAGKLVACGPLEELQQHVMPHRQIQVTVLGQVELAEEILKGTAGVLNISQMPGNQNGGRVRLEIEFMGEDTALTALLANLVQQGIPIVHFSEDSRDLEEVFMRATKGMVT